MDVSTEPGTPRAPQNLIAFLKEKLKTPYAKFLVGIVIGLILLVLIGLSSYREETSMKKIVEVRPTPMSKPTEIPTPTSIPAITTIPTSNTLVTKATVPTILPSTAQEAVTTATSAPTATDTPTPQPPDTNAPTITSMTGPENGSTISFNSFCFPATINDDRSKYPNIFTQYQFDSTEWTSWGNDVSPCFSSVSDGVHTYSFHAKDEAGNVSSTVTRTFTVQN